MLESLIRKFRLTVVGEYTGQLLHGVWHPSLLNPGAEKLEKTCVLPGDEHIPKPSWQATRAITINTSPEKIWPWLVQMGFERGGWYAWFPLQNDKVYSYLCISADRIIPELQSLKVGDVLLDGPNCDKDTGAWNVKSIDEYKSIVLHSARTIPEGLEFKPDEQKIKGMWINCSWLFYLKKIDDKVTRLIVRTRIDYGPKWLGWFMIGLFGGGDTVMQNTMLQGIKERAEK